MDRTCPSYKVQTRSRVPISNCPHGVPSVPINPFPTGDPLAQLPQGDISNVKSHYSIHLLTQLVTSKLCQSDPIGVVVISSKVTRVGQFMRLISLNFTGSKIKEDPQSFIYYMEKVF